jgi:EAL and modified HD-GYP domain-containing signal transduction protein
MNFTLDSENVSSVFVARQPIFDVHRNIWGYELLYRNCGDSSATCILDEAGATVDVIADGMALATVGLSSDKRVLINFPRQLLLDDAAFALPGNQCVIEVLENVDPEPEVLDALARLKKAGYELALDDYTGEGRFEPFMPLMDYVKVDILGMNIFEINRVAQSLKPYGVTLLAEKIETPEIYKATRGIGFSLFQGYFFCRPEVLSGRKISANQISKMQILRELGGSEYHVAELARMIGEDMSLAYRLLRFINSASFSLPNKIESIRQATVFLGRRQLSQWLRVVIMADMATSSLTSELAYLSSTRARFLELIAGSEETVEVSPDSMFLLGLFSLLDALLGRSMEELLRELPLDDAIADALLGRESTMRTWLDIVMHLEKGHWDSLETMLREQGLVSENVARAYARAQAWTGEVFGSLA